MRKFLILLLLLKQVANGCCQQPDTIRAEDPQQVTVQSFQRSSKLVDVAAPVNYISSIDLNRFGNNSLVPAVNATAGARMEERSPGSYRISIRGSSLRSPFGVRNVKIYYNNIPFTDPGGQTYLNQLGYNSVQSMEIIKGPASSLYGAGTGGVMLLFNRANTRDKGVFMTYTMGSYAMQNLQATLCVGNEHFTSAISYEHMHSNGYRRHSSLERDVLNWETTHSISAKDKISASVLYGDLFYETPGALTRKEYEADAQQARPAIGTIPGSELANASVRQRTFLLGVTYEHTFGDHWDASLSAYGTYSKLENPTIRNYGVNNEPHTGGRTSWNYKSSWGLAVFQWQTGAELQYGHSTNKVYDNKFGNRDTLRGYDEIANTTGFFFTQVNIDYKRWKLTGGVSYNRQSLAVSHLQPLPGSSEKISFNNKLAPRVALLFKLQNDLSLYTSVSKGFSPPTVTELFPSGSAPNAALDAEQGWNYEAGIKGTIIKRRLFADVSVFHFNLKNTIVQRRDATGGDYFINAGSTSQAGVESQLWYRVFADNALFAPGKLWVNYTMYRFKYQSFQQLLADYSGNQLPGTAPTAFGAGADVVLKAGWYANIAYQYVDAIPLNDANTEFAGSYHLLSAKIGYKPTAKRLQLNAFMGGDNLLNVRYSLGNDINGFGGRYYNAAAGRNVYFGLSIGLSAKKK